MMSMILMSKQTEDCNADVFMWDAKARITGLFGRLLERYQNSCEFVMSVIMASETPFKR